MLNRPYDVGPGWWPLLDDLVERLKALDPEVQVSFKEKYGVCQIDFVTESAEHFNEIAKQTNAAEDRSGSICEVCGGVGGRVNRQNWYLTLCDRCASLNALERRKVYAETEERYYRGSHTRHGQPQDREEVRCKKLKDFLSTDDRQDVAQSLFGILPPDAKGKRFYTQEEVEKELGLDKEILKNLDDVEFE